MARDTTPEWEPIDVRAEQRRRWNRCEICGSEAIEGGNFEADGLQAWQHVKCLVCGSDWDEVYEASARELVVDMTEAKEDEK